MVDNQLFSPLSLGNVKLKHRVVMAPVTRYRADNQHIPTDMMREYYAQRASVPGTLLITEATFVSPRASGQSNVPGIWNDQQIAAWRKVTDAVHERRCFIFLQLWAMGRRAEVDVLRSAEGGPYPVVGPSEISAGGDGSVVPHVLTVDEIRVFVEDFASAAKNAIAAGFDGVEIHGANGYLVDQFLQEIANNRTDEYGGSIENRARFGLEVTKAVIEAVGDSKKVAMRLSPWTFFEESRKRDPIPQFSYMVAELEKLGLAYLHLVESRYAGDVTTASYHVLTHRNDPLIEIWGSKAPVILAGGFTPDTARKATDEVYRNSNVCVAFGRYYISTPDLPYRISEGISLNPYHRETFYLKMNPEGYIDYPFSTEYMTHMMDNANGSS